MTRYTNVRVNISEQQKVKIKKAFQAGSGVSIKLAHRDLSGEHVIAFTEAQVKKLMRAYQTGTGMTVKLSKTQLAHNMKVEGGFLPAILGFLGSTAAPFLLKTALPALATGALSGLANTGVSKALGAGGAFYVKRGGQCYKLTPQGQGLHLKPWVGSGLNSFGEGLYLKTGSGFLDGSGLLLGQNNPISNLLSSIPILGPILGTVL